MTETTRRSGVQFIAPTSAALSHLSTDEAVRIELIRLVYRHDQTSEQIIARAQELEAYVTQADKAVDAPVKRGPGRPRNADKL